MAAAIRGAAVFYPAHQVPGFTRLPRFRSSQSANFRIGDRANFNHNLFDVLEKSRLNGQTRIQIAQSDDNLVQKLKHFSAFDVHFFTPFMAELFLPPTTGGPKGKALTGQASAHLVQISQKAATPSFLVRHLSEVCW